MTTATTSPRAVGDLDKEAIGCMDIQCKTTWTRDEVSQLYFLPFNELLFRAQSIHRSVFDPGKIQVSTLLSIKTGGCPEDCKYCPQSIRYHTEVAVEELLEAETVREKVVAAKASGATRFCMGAAWRHPKDRDLDRVIPLLKEVKSAGMESCLTLGMLSEEQAVRLAEAGLDYYNHNLDTSEEYYQEVITTRSYADRLRTLEHVRKAGIKVCCGGIVGLGESVEDRIGLLWQLARLDPHPESVPINELVKVEGTPMENNGSVDPFEIVRTVACARVLMPYARVRLAAGRTQMSDELQALCFFAGANSIFYGERLLTTPNPEIDRDRNLFSRLGLKAESLPEGTAASPQ